jgi:hypothetical protein
VCDPVSSLTILLFPLNTTDTRNPGSSYPTTVPFWTDFLPLLCFYYVKVNSSALPHHYLSFLHGWKRIIRCHRSMINGIDRPTLHSMFGEISCSAHATYCPMLTLDKIKEQNAPFSCCSDGLIWFYIKKDGRFQYRVFHIPLLDPSPGNGSHIRDTKRTVLLCITLNWKLQALQCTLMFCKQSSSMYSLVGFSPSGRTAVRETWV